MYCQERSGKSSLMGEDFWCNTRSKTLLVKLLPQYLKVDRNTIVNNKDDADKHIGGPASVFECEKRCYCICRRHIHILFCTYWKRRLGKSSWKPTVRSMKLKSWWISLRLQREVLDIWSTFDKVDARCNWKGQR